MSGFTAEANFTFNTPSQRTAIDIIGERRAKPFTNPNKPLRAETETVESHVALILRKLVVIFLFILVAVLGLISTIIGAIAYTRNCYSPRQPSIPIWLLVLGGMSIILVSVLTLLILLSITCKYKTSDKKFRIIYIITIGIATAVLEWANAPGTQAAFNLSSDSIQCLGFIYNFSVALYFILIICSLIGAIYAIYKNRHRCCCEGVLQAIPVNSCITQLVPMPNTFIGTIPVDTNTEMKSTEGAPVDIRSEMTSTENTSEDNRREMTSIESTPVDIKIEMNSTEKAFIQS